MKQPGGDGKTSFNVGSTRKIVLAKLVGELEFPNETELLRALIDEKIKQALPHQWGRVKNSDAAAESRLQQLNESLARVKELVEKLGINVVVQEENEKTNEPHKAAG